VETERDRFGLGWRAEYAASLLVRLDRIDVVEVLIEPALRLDRAGRDALAALARTTSVHLHGTGLGLASTEVVDPKRLDAVARLVGALRPEGWSEHLAFVRAGGMEIGHLAAPPRGRAVLEGLSRNVAAARRAVGAAPALENVASLVEPPGNEFDEAAWLRAASEGADVDLLLDLHNLHANATNFRFDARTVLDALPWDRVGRVHLAGGSWIEGFGARRLLDDHRHDVPDAVLELLADAGARATRPLTVVLEQDGDFPPFSSLTARLDDARAALARGRAARRESVRPRAEDPAVRAPRTGLSEDRGPRLAGLAALFVDADVRARFLADPAAEGPRLGLGAGPFDLAGVALAARSFAAKRARK
jgi:uncharacterized protein (UPF0276 family)